MPSEGYLCGFRAINLQLILPLHNTRNGKLLKEQIRSSRQDRVTVSFYKYHHLEDAAGFRDMLYAAWDALGIMGRTYVASEGINAQISVPRESFNEFRSHLDSIPFLKGLRLNLAIQDDGKSFFKLKILLRKKIVADGIDDPAFDVTQCGVHVDAATFNKLAANPETIIVDMRNHYESEVGHFRNAVCPDVDTLREELQVVEDLMKGKEDKNLLMYCTGGIRCEKASAWMKHKGFANVFQLEGGIIHYSRQVKEQGLENRFIGKNFVFDERMGERISPDIISKCHQCGAPCDDHTNCLNEACHLLFIQCEACRNRYEGCCSEPCTEVARRPEEVQRELRKGKAQQRKVFSKGRASRLQETQEE
ncbi:MAG: rhodanese-related sulfurtransferase [Bacteroidota bacterium]